MNKIIINSLSNKDWKKYKKIRLEALKINPEAFLNSYADVLKYPDQKWQEDLRKSAKKDGTFYLFAFDKDKIVGMNGAHWRNDKKTISHIIEVFGVFVTPAYRGQGIGKKLMEGVINEVKKDSQFKKIKLGVNAQNLPALKLYQNCGLKIVGKLEKELKFGNKYCDEIMMEMMIN